MTKEKPCTYVTWPEGTPIKPEFFRACSPVQASEKLLVVEKPLEVVEEIAKKHGQKSIAMAAGHYRQ